MKITPLVDVPLDGDMALIYSPNEIGKTVSTLLSAPSSIFVLDVESRPLGRTIDVVKEVRPDVEIDFGEWESFDDTMSFLNDYQKNLIDKKYRTLFVDSYTALMAMELIPELQRQAYEARKKENKASTLQTKDIISQFKVTEELYGGVGTGTIRITGLLKKIAATGIVVICSALEDRDPKTRILTGCELNPLFEGKQFMKAMPGNFNLIGRLRSRKDKDGKIVYPPMIDFRDDAGGKFLAKYTGLEGKTTGPLDWSKILRKKEGE